MNQTDTLQLGITFQMSLDAFLEDELPTRQSDESLYEQALHILEEANGYRSQQKKSEIAKQAIQLCPDCIEAYQLYAMNSRDIYKRISILRRGTELATMNLGKEYFMRKIEDFYEEEAAKVLLTIKYHYAVSLYEAGCISKAVKQFQEILNLNPSDVYCARHYLCACMLYLEQIELCRGILQRYEEDTYAIYVEFLLLVKDERIKEAISWIPKLKASNVHLYDLLTYHCINTTTCYEKPIAGTFEEASYCYKILSKILMAMEYLPQFLMDHES